MMLTKSVWQKSCLGKENKRDQFLVCAKRTETKFDLTKAVLPMKLSSPGCPMVTIKSETLLYMSTPECHTSFIVIRHTDNQRTDGILTISMNRDSTKYDPYLLSACIWGKRSTLHPAYGYPRWLRWIGHAAKFRPKESNLGFSFS